MRTLLPAECRVRPATAGGEKRRGWWYVGRDECTFHTNGASIIVPTSRIRRALEAMDRQAARMEESPDA